MAFFKGSMEACKGAGDYIGDDDSTQIYDINSKEVC